MFGYLVSLNDRQALEQHYKEEADLAHSEFRFKQKDNTSSYVVNIARRLQTKPSQFILHEAPYRQFDYDHVMELLSFITPGNCVGFLCTDVDFMKECVNQEEPVYEINYGKMPIQCM